MKFIPHNYQEMAVEKICSTPRCGLFLDMGLGKTVITLTAIEELMYNRFEVSRVLVIAPLRVAEDTWSRECQKWEHLQNLRVSKILGTAPQRKTALQQDADIYIINRENVVWLTKSLKNWCFDMVVIDELSSFKSPKAQRFRALKKYIAHSNRVVGLTGTPAPNGLIDLWSQIYLIDGGERLGRTVTGYRERYFTPDKRNQTTIFSYKPKENAETAIMTKISDICISMRAEDWLAMPERIDTVIRVTLTEEQMKAYREFERSMYMQLEEKNITAVNSASLVNKLLQCANGAVYTDSGNYISLNDSKLNALAEILDTANGKPILCFYNFRFDLERIQQKFPFAVKLTDSKDIDLWNRGEIPLLLVHPASAGHGLNLQAGGNIIVWYGLTWSLELYEQANARLYRQGQQNTVIVHHLIAENTCDERVYSSLHNKANVQEELIQALKAKYESEAK